MAPVESCLSHKKALFPKRLKYQLTMVEVNSQAFISCNIASRKINTTLGIDPYKKVISYLL